MEQLGVTDKIAKYIQDNDISILTVSNDTGVAEKKLIPNSGMILNASEFLSLCAYLKVRPEIFRE